METVTRGQMIYLKLCLWVIAASMIWFVACNLFFRWYFKHKDYRD